MRYLKIIFTLTLYFTLNNTNAQTAISFSIDTTQYTLKINGTELSKPSIKKVQSALKDITFRKVARAAKTLYIYDALGIVIEEDSKGLAYRFFYVKGEKTNDPNSEFQGTLTINNLLITKEITIFKIKEQLPKVEKTMLMEDNLIYLGDKFVLTGESGNGVLKEVDFGIIGK